MAAEVVRCWRSCQIHIHGVHGSYDAGLHNRYHSAPYNVPAGWDGRLPWKVCWALARSELPQLFPHWPSSPAGSCDPIRAEMRRQAHKVSRGNSFVLKPAVHPLYFLFCRETAFS